MDINIGKILIQPKDNWNATTPYEYLNLVRYNKNLYICKSVTGAPVGTLPTNTSYYMHITADGIDAQEIQLQKTATEIQWKRTSDAAWTTLVALSAIKGDKGDTGAKGDAAPNTIWQYKTEGGEWTTDATGAVYERQSGDNGITWSAAHEYPGVAALNAKANVTDVNAALALKAPLASPILTGIPTAPTAPLGTNTTQLATTEFVKTSMQTLDSTVNQDDITKEHSLAWWISYFDGAEATIRVLRGTHQVTADMTIPENICLKFNKGANLKVSDTKTLTINGAIEAGLWQIFGGEGTVTGTPQIPYVYPEWFGAKGDGNSDDTTAIQKTINIASAIILSRSYRISKSINLLSNRHITTQSNGEIICDGTNCAFTTASTGVYTNIKITDIKITGDNTLDTANFLIYIINCSTVDILNCTVSNGYYGITARNCTNVTIAGCKTHDNYAGILSYGSDLKTIITNNFTYNNTLAGIDVISGNDTTSSMIISNNIVTDNGNTGIICAGGALNNLEIHSNVIRNCGNTAVTGHAGERQGINIHGSISCIINNNLISDCYGGIGINGNNLVDPNVLRSEHIILSNNNIKNSTEDGIVIFYLNNVLIEGNYLYKNKWSNVRLYVAQNVTIRNNVSISAADTTQNAHIWLRAQPLKNIVIDGNTFIGDLSANTERHRVLRSQDIAVSDSIPENIRIIWGINEIETNTGKALIEGGIYKCIQLLSPEIYISPEFDLAGGTKVIGLPLGDLVKGGWIESIKLYKSYGTSITGATQINLGYLYNSNYLINESIDADTFTNNTLQSVDLDILRKGFIDADYSAYPLVLNITPTSATGKITLRIQYTKNFPLRG